MVKQITGAIARRICPWAVVGDKLTRGERFGMIRFGSRTELFFPMDAEVLIKLGDRVVGGETAVVKFQEKP
jgi:phosphatidylserine decarboxylase